MDLKFYFSLFLRRLHWFVLFLVIGSAVGLTLAQVLPPVYVAQARLLVESEQIPGELAASTVRTEATEQLEIIQQRILTRDTLVDMANRLNIYGGTQAENQMSTEDLVEDMRERIGIVTTGGAERRGPVRATVVSVNFEAPSAALAATVTNEVVTLILREDISMRTRTARQTLEFFQQEVDRLDAELVDRGAVILEFKEENQEALPDSLEFRRTQQAANQERLLQLEREESALRDRRARAERINELSNASGNPAPGSTLTDEQQQLRALEDELTAQLSILSPENPRVVLLQARIRGLRTIVEQQLAQQGDTSETGRPITAYQAQLAEIDGQLAFIANQKEQVQTNLSNLAASLERTPGNSIALDTLERDYANVRAQYDQAVSNMARAETGDVIETLRQGQRITVVEQAVTPNAPEKPNRLLIAAGGIGGGIVMGLAMVVLLELLNKGIRRPEDVSNALGITPFAVLPYYRTRGENLRRRSIIIGVVGGALVGIPLLLWGVDTFYAPLEQLIGAYEGADAALRQA
jgi:uncharacterized protein involved in exopolysaccharide biosynthesis